MDINERLRAAFDEYVATRASVGGLCFKWKLNSYMLKACLALHELLPLTEKRELEPRLNYVPRNGTGRPKLPVQADQGLLIERALETFRNDGWYEVAKRAKISTQSLRRYATSKRGLPPAVRVVLESIIASKTESDIVRV